MAETNSFIPYERETYSASEMYERASNYYQWLDKRRTVREFSDRPISREVIEQLIMAASTAPSGAHKQPWTFCAIGDPVLKTQIRKAAEEEEHRNYNGRMSDEWLEDLQAFGTDWNKPFLEIAPWLVVIFKRSYEMVNGAKKKNYYVNESVGLAAGFFLSAIHEAGLVALTHTPSPMDFLTKLLNRPSNERPFLLIPVGYPAENVTVPDLTRKSVDDVAVFFEKKKDE